MAPRVVGTYASPVATRASQKATTCGRVRATVSYYYSVNGRTAYMTADPAGRVCSAVAINNQRRLFEWKLGEIYRISFGVDLDACICYGKSRNMEQQRQTYVQQHAAAHRHTTTRPTIERFNTRRGYNLASQTAHTLVIHSCMEPWTGRDAIDGDASRPLGERISGSAWCRSSGGGSRGTCRRGTPRSCRRWRSWTGGGRGPGTCGSATGTSAPPPPPPARPLQHAAASQTSHHQYRVHSTEDM